MTTEEQLDQWVRGTSLHNAERNECCPDFSCCQKNYRATDQERVTFRNRPALRDFMLVGFLAGALAAMGINAYVAGSSEGEA